MAVKSFNEKKGEGSIFKRQYNPADIDPEVLTQIENFEQQALELRRKAGMFVHIYIQSSHPTLVYGLLLRGRRIMWIEVEAPKGKKSGKRRYGTIESYSPITAKELEKEVDPIVLNEIKYAGEQYVKIVALEERGESLAMIHGCSEYYYLQKFNVK